METLHARLLASIDEHFTILAPNRRAAHALRLAYGEHAVASGQLAWLTPDVLTLRAWMERTWFGCSSRDRTLRLLSSQQVLVLWDRIVADSDAARSLLNPSSAARAAARSWDLVQGYGLSLADIAAGGSEEAEVFAGWARKFETLCAEHRWLPPGRLAQTLVHCQSLATAQLHLALPEAPTPAEVALLAHLEQSGSTIRREVATDTMGTAHVCAAADPDQELLHAALWARSQLEAGRQPIAIVVPDLQNQRHRVRRALEETFVPGMRLSGKTKNGVPFAIAASGTLDEFPVVQAALDMLALVQGKAPSTLAGVLLRSPFVAGYETESSARARADVRLREAAAEHFAVPELERLAAANECPVLAQRLGSLRPLLPRTEMLPPSEWAERLLKLLQGFGWPGDRTLSSEEQQTLVKFNTCLSEFGSLEDLLGRIDFATALREFGQWVTATPFEPQTLPTPIVILDPDSVAGTHFAALWVMGCEASRWPPAPDPDPFLPLALQQRAAIPNSTVDDTRDRAQREFAALSGAAETVVFSWPRREGDAEQTPSPLLAGLQDEEPVADVRPDFRESLYRQRPLLDLVSDPSAPAVAAGQVHGGSRIVELQSWCPFRAQAELRLAARPLNQVAPGVDARERGTLLHRALETLWSELRSHRGLQAHTPEVLRERVHAVLDRLSVSLLAGVSAHRARLLQIEVDIAARKICELLEIERQRQPFRVLERPEFSQSYGAAGLVLDLKIDRIDILEGEGEGTASGEVIIDYKTGSSAHPSKWWGSRPEQPQLPLYAVARGTHLAAVAFALLNARESGFKGVAREEGILPGLKAHPATRSIPPEALDWHRMLIEWEHTVDGLIAGFAQGDARVDPLPHLCAHCHLSSFCRIHEAHPQAFAEDEPT